MKRAATAMGDSIRSAQGRERSHGFSLIELMVAMVIGLLLLGGMLAVVLTSAETGRVRERASEVQNNGRYALDLLKRNAQHAGFIGHTGLLQPDAPVSFAVSRVCDVNVIGKLTLRVWASNNANPYAGSCLPDAEYVAGTDVLVLRNLSPGTVAALQKDVIYFRSAYEGGEAFVGTAAPDFKTRGWTAEFDYQVEEAVYYISPWTTAANESPRVPALYRLRLTTGPAMVPELVASGIENMQVRARQNISPTTFSYLAPQDVTDWSAVTAIEVSLLVRTSVPEPGLKNRTTFEMSDEIVTVPTDDGFRRQVFTSVFNLRNQ